MYLFLRRIISVPLMLFLVHVSKQWAPYSVLFEWIVLFNMGSYKFQIICTLCVINCGITCCLFVMENIDA